MLLFPSAAMVSKRCWSVKMCRILGRIEVPLQLESRDVVAELSVSLTKGADGKGYFRIVDMGEIARLHDTSFACVHIDPFPFQAILIHIN